MELKESAAVQAPAARQLPGDLREIVGKLELRLEKAELKIKKSSAEESAFPSHVPGSLPGKSVDDTLANVNEFSNELVHSHPQVEERDSSPAGHFTPGT